MLAGTGAVGQELSQGEIYEIQFLFSFYRNRILVILKLDDLVSVIRLFTKNEGRISNGK